MVERRKRKRANGLGSTFQRRSDGLWVAAVTVQGQSIRAYAADEKTASEKLRRLLNARDDGDIEVLRSRQTVAGHVADWLDANRPPKLVAGTWKGYEQLMRLYVLPTLGARRLGTVTARELDRLYARARAAGRSEVTVKHLHAACHRCFAQAVRWRLLTRNPADEVDRPKGEPAQRQTLSTEETRRLLAEARGHRLGAVVVLAVTLGLREGEICGLRWQDVDFDAGTLTVSGAMKRGESGFVRGSPKSASSRRTMRLPRIAVEALRRRRAVQIEERLAAGSTWKETGLVFTRASKRFGYGGRIGQTHIVDEILAPMLDAAHLPRVTLHDLRHTHATEGLRRRIPTKVMSAALGHSRTAITSDLYSHVTEDMSGEIAATMDALFGG